MGSVDGVAGAVQGLPFALENAHHTCIESRGVARSKRHDTETILRIIGGEEGKFFLILESDCDLVVSSLVIQGDEIEATGGVAEVVNSVVATRDRVFERKSHLIEATIRDTQTPNKLSDIDDVFLMGLCSKDDGRSPGAKTFADPTVGFEHVDMSHDDLAFVRAVMRFLAADGRGGAGINCKFKV